MEGALMNQLRAKLIGLAGFSSVQYPSNSPKSSSLSDQGQLKQVGGNRPDTFVLVAPHYEVIL